MQGYGMKTKSLQNKADSCTNEAGPRVLETPTAPRHEPPAEEVTDMPFEHDVRHDAHEIKQNNTGTWRHIGDVAARLVEKARKG